MDFTQEEIAPLAEFGLTNLTPDNAVAMIATALGAAGRQVTEASTAETTALSRATAAETEAATLATELETVQQEKLALSRGPAQPDALSLSLITEAFGTRKERAITSGAMSQAEADELEKLFYDGDKPNGLALSMTAGSHQPLLARLYDLRTKFAGTAAVATDGSTLLSRANVVPVVTGDKKAEDRMLSEAEYRAAMGDAGQSVSPEDYQRYCSARGK